MTVKTQAADLARMLTVDPVDAAVWQPQDLGAILRDQLGQSVAVDLMVAGMGSPRDPAAEPIKGPPNVPVGPIETFADLLHHPRPPLALLRQIKHFAKLNHAHPTVLPRDVASVLYLASIVAAQRRCGARITGLDDHELRTGIRWAADQPWVDERTRTLLADGDALFGGGNAEGTEARRRGGTAGEDGAD